MSTRPQTAEDTTDYNYVRFGRHAKILEQMTTDEFDKLVAGELEPETILERHELDGGER